MTHHNVTIPEIANALHTIGADREFVEHHARALGQAVVDGRNLSETIASVTRSLKLWQFAGICDGMHLPDAPHVQELFEVNLFTVDRAAQHSRTKKFAEGLGVELVWIGPSSDGPDHGVTCSVSTAFYRVFLALDGRVEDSGRTVSVSTRRFLGLIAPKASAAGVQADVARRLRDEGWSVSVWDGGRPPSRGSESSTPFSNTRDSRA